MEKIDKNKSIKDLASEDRPREKLVLRGVNALSDSELLAILLGSGGPNESAIDVATNILKSADYNLNQLARLSIADLTKIKRVGLAKAITIIAALELGRRQKITDALSLKKITSSNDGYQFFHPLISNLPHEESWLLLLDNANQIISHKKIGQGGITGTVMDVRLILKYTLENNATKLILAHNHPSGNLSPSEADNNITKKISEGAKLLDLQLLDHLIITLKGYYSFADEGEL